MSRDASASFSGTTREEIRRLERVACASWPALEAIALDGWLLGLSGAYTRRANCVSPCAAPAVPAVPALPLAARVAEVEAQYASRGASAVFKMTAAAEPDELDAFLQAWGYGRHSETVVIVLPDLAELPESRPKRPGDGGGHFKYSAARPSHAWLDASCVFSRVPAELRSDYEAILERLRATQLGCAYGSWTVDGVIQSVALAVRCEGITSFHQVATNPAARGRRYADRVLRGLLASASEQGAASAMLSVEAENTSARRLYDRLGFREIYRDWYRER